MDYDYLVSILLELLNIHSPSGYTDPIVRRVSEELEALDVPYTLTRRGAIRADLEGRRSSPDRAIVVHLDTLGAMVKALKPNGRLKLVPVGNWSSRFAEGARVSIFCDEHLYRGTIMPLKASGHTYNDDVDTQPSSWEHVEVRVDQKCTSQAHLQSLGFNVGDFVGVDSQPELLPNGFLNARHLDDKAGVAIVLTVLKAIRDREIELPVDCHVLFTISEEVGSGASAGLHGDVTELVTLDNGTVAPGQNTSLDGVTVAMADSTGPFDFHLSHFLLGLCKEHGIAHARDIFRYYRCDSASAVEAGNDIRTALLAFGVDGSHGYERVHLDSLKASAELVWHYLQCDLIYEEQEQERLTLEDFPDTRSVKVNSKAPSPAEPVLQTPPSN